MKTSPFSKSVLTVLAIGAVIGGFAVANLQNIVPMVQAGSETPVVRTIGSITAENMAALRTLDESFASLAEFAQPSVVHIRSEGQGGSDVLGRRMGRSGGVGTGVIFRSDGWIITNDHVVNGFDKVTVILADGREFKGQVRSAEESDLAVVKIEAKDLPAANFGDSNKVRPGQFAMAVGSPFGLDNTVTIGHISALNRENSIPDPRLADGARYYPDLIQTDAPINQGNSGGPLINIEGQVIGINSAIISSTGGSNGIGFAIPSNLARFLAETLIEKGKVERGAMGLIPANLKPFERAEKKIDGGAVVEQVPNNSPAAVAGIKQGDIITRVGTFPIKNQMDVRLAMYRYAPGQSVEVEIIRGTEKKSIKVTLADPKKLNAGNPSPQQRPDSDDGGMSPFEDFPQIPGWNIPRESPDDSEVPPVREGQARLGIQMEALTAENRKKFFVPANVEGVLVIAVEPGSVAAKLGIEPGTVISKLGTKSIRSPQDVTETMKGLKWGDRTQISFAKYSEKSQLQQSTDVVFR